MYPQQDSTLTKTGEGEYTLSVDAWGDYPLDYPDLSQIPLRDPGWYIPADVPNVEAPPVLTAGFPWWLLVVLGVALYASKGR